MKTRPQIAHLRQRGVALLLALGLLLSEAAPLLDASRGPVASAQDECAAYASPNGDDDNGDGSIDDPFRTIRTLALSLEAGETGCLMAGETFFQPNDGFGILPTGVKGTPEQPITIRSSPGGWATYTGVLQIGASDVIVTGISFAGRGALPNPKNPHILIFGDRVTLERNIITTPKGICIQIGNAGDASQGIAKDRAVDVTISNNRIFGCGLENLTGDSPDCVPATDSCSHGIYVQNTLRARIEDNYIYDNAVRGVQLWPSAEETSIQRNILHNNSANLTIGSCWSGVCIDKVGAVQSTQTTVRDNVISNANFQFFPDDSNQVNGDFGPGSPTHGNVVTGNCVWHPDQSVREGTNGTFRLFGGRGYDYGQAINPVYGDNVLANPQYLDANNPNRGEKDFRMSGGSGCALMGPLNPPPSLAGDPPADTTPPTVTVTSPQNGAEIGAGQLIAVAATDASGISTVEIGVCSGAGCDPNESLVIDYEAPFEETWANPPAAGPAALVAIATDPAGNTAVSDVVRVTITDSTPPTVQLTSPNEGAEIVAGQRLAATATDNVAIDRVEFRYCPGDSCAGVDGTSIFTDNQQPYEHDWNDLPAPGAYVLKAVGWDTAGNVRHSDVVHVTIPDDEPEPDTTPPTVAVTSPNAGAVVAAGQVLRATASDASGIDEVEFRYCPGTTCVGAPAIILGTDDTAPYEYTWTALPDPGAYVVKAVAWDNASPRNAQHSDLVRITIEAVEDPSLSLDPVRGLLGTEITATVRGFPDSEPVTVRWHASAAPSSAAQVVGVGDTDGEGVLVLTFTVPPGSAPGAHLVRGESVGRFAEAETTFTVAYVKKKRGNKGKKGKNGKKGKKGNGKGGGRNRR